MKVCVVVENWVTRMSPYLIGEWGLSLWVGSAEPTLIDTGLSGTAVCHNAAALGLDLSQIRHILLSHAHVDHCGGLSSVLKACPQATVWAGADFRRRRWLAADGRMEVLDVPELAGLEFRPVPGAVQVAPRLWAFDVPAEERDERFSNGKGLAADGEDGQPVQDRFRDDLSFVLEGDNGPSLLLGCSHAALPNVFRRAKKLFNGLDSYHCVLGGTHMQGLSPADMDLWLDDFKHWGVKKWRLCHCTGFQPAVRLRTLFDDVEWAGCGTVLDL
ncbi:MULTISPECIES: MBL fold metallo-hydrolase [Jonquetella]|uniref:MBL fold metallo-hydrolase n=1 Tax=Jonquetella TaxID=428711 RepID=UPI0003ADA917|nr:MULTISPECIES: MBL fold metallo-hydrolase [Jonquetella]ERL23968.1 metallo-beta-lactamase domain protein [Jonquetella sp. BV3C21]